MSVVRAIEFENNRLKVCYSGQLLQGQAKISFPVDTHVKGTILRSLAIVSNNVRVKSSSLSHLHYIRRKGILQMVQGK